MISPAWSLAGNASSTLGADHVRRLVPATKPDEVQRRLALTGEALRLQETVQPLPLDGLTDLSEVLGHAQLDGAWVEVEKV